MALDDLQDINKIEKESFPIPWEREVFEKELSNMLATYLVAKENKKVIGFIGAWFILDECQITCIAVDSDSRRQGIASKLVAKLFSECKKHGTKYISLEVRTNNISAQKLYSKLGFQNEIIRKQYYKNPDGTRDDALIMSMKII